MTLYQLEDKYNCLIWSSGKQVCYRYLTDRPMIIRYPGIEPVIGVDNEPELVSKLEKILMKEARERKLERLIDDSRSDR